MGFLLAAGLLLLPLRTLAVPGPQAGAAPTGIVSLAELRGQTRPLLIFAAKPADPQLQIQLRRLNQNAAAVSERDVVAIALPYRSPATTAAMLSDGGAEAVRRRFDVAPNEFAVILIGKDGSEKLRSSQPISIEKLCRTIDATSTRQRTTTGKR